MVFQGLSVGKFQNLETKKVKRDPQELGNKMMSETGKRMLSKSPSEESAFKKRINT